MGAGGDTRPPRPNMEGVCIGFAPGSSALTEVPLLPGQLDAELASATG